MLKQLNRYISNNLVKIRNHKIFKIYILTNPSVTYGHTIFFLYSMYTLFKTWRIPGKSA